MEYNLEASFLGPLGILKRCIVLDQCRLLLCRVNDGLFYIIRAREFFEKLEKERKNCLLVWGAMSERRIAEFFIWFFQSNNDWPSLNDIKFQLEVMVPEKFVAAMECLGDMELEDAERSELIKNLRIAIYRCVKN